MAPTTSNCKTEDIDLDEFEAKCFDMVHHHINTVKGIHMDVTSDALQEAFAQGFAVVKKVLRMASRVAQIKGVETVDRAEVEQATKMDCDGVETYLPPASSW